MFFSFKVVLEYVQALLCRVHQTKTIKADINGMNVIIIVYKPNVILLKYKIVVTFSKLGHPIILN